MFNISDLIVILIVSLAAFLGYKRGFVKTSFRIFSFIIAIILSLILYKPVAAHIKENTNISNWIISTIMNEDDEENINEENQEDIVEDIENDTNDGEDTEEFENNQEIIESDKNESTQEEIIDNENSYEIEEILANLPQNVKDYIGADETINQAKEQIAVKISDAVINIMSMICIYIIAKLILMIVCFILDGIMQIPILKQLNEVAGLLLGIILGIIQVYTVLAVITFLSSIIEMPELVAYIKSSFIASILFEYNLLITLIF